MTMEFLDEIFNETERRLADWKDVDEALRREGAPDGLTLSGKLAWVLSDLKSKLSIAETKASLADDFRKLEGAA